jgi:xanthine dehydrogenase accessory factor
VYLSDYLAVVRGGGGLGTAVAHRLSRSGFTVLVTELAQPLALHRGAAFAEAVYRGQASVEGLTARLADDAMLGMAFTVVGEVPVLVDLADDVVARMQPAIVVDARQAGRNLGTRREEAKLVIGLGQGFSAEQDCHALIDTERGPDLGRVFWDNAARPAGAPRRRGRRSPLLLTATTQGQFQTQRAIGDRVQAGEALGGIDDEPVLAPAAGVLCGLLHDRVPVTPGQKLAEVDPHREPAACFVISSRARAIAGGVLEAVLGGMDLWRSEADAERREE